MNILFSNINSSTLFPKPVLRKGSQGNYQDNPIYSKNISADTVSFTGAAPNASPLRKLFAYKIPDLYSPIILLNPDKADSIFKSKVFSRDIASIIKELSHISSSFQGNEKKFFEMMKEEAEKNPHIYISDFIAKLLPEHNDNLLKIQYPKFDKLKNLSKNLPEKVRQQFNSLMSLTDKQLKNEPILLPFSAEEFNYVFRRKIRTRIGYEHGSAKTDALNELQTIISHFPRKPRSNKPSEINRYEHNVRETLKRFRDYYNHSVLKNENDIKRLIDQSQDRIDKKPVQINFSRKNFIFELQRILKPCDDKSDVVTEMLMVAKSFPTSKDNFSALIVKLSNRTNDQIAHDLLCGSIGNIDHIVPRSEGGPSEVSNYVMSSCYENSKKGNKSLTQCIEENPRIVNFAESQLYRFMELLNKGVFRKVGLSKDYICNFADIILKSLPEGTTLKFDTSKLK